jgi:hypothetical protein
MNVGGSVHQNSVDKLGNALACELGVVSSNGVARRWAQPRPIHGYYVVLPFVQVCWNNINPLNPELNPICYLLALLAHHFLHVSRVRVKSLTLRLLMSYIYIWSAYSSSGRRPLTY